MFRDRRPLTSDIFVLLDVEIVRSGIMGGRAQSERGSRAGAKRVVSSIVNSMLACLHRSAIVCSILSWRVLSEGPEIRVAAVRLCVHVKAKLVVAGG